MKFNYKFNNLLGTVYRQGNLVFSKDGNSVLSPVGNKISVYDLKSHKSSTIPVESRFNYTALALSPSGSLLLAVNSDGEVHLISLISQTILHRLRTNRTVTDIQFSPDGRYFALTKESVAMVYRAPGPQNHQFNPWGLERVLKGAFDDTTCVQWSPCSRIVAVGAKDNTTRIYALQRFKNFKVYCLGGHNEPIVRVFFDKDFRVYTLSRNGHLLIWESSVSPDQLEPEDPDLKSGKKKKKKEVEDEDEDLGEPAEEDDESKAVVANEEEQSKTQSKLYYTRTHRHFLNDALPKESSEQSSVSSKRHPELTSADYHSGTRILVTGFSSGVFLIHELPEASLVHSLSISDQSIMSVTLNPAGDWIAFGCEHLGQLLVWEWQSETYVLKQQGHFNSMACVAYSTDGGTIATGSDDGKVKLWDSTSGFCYVTFNEHLGAVSGVAFAPPAGKVVLSASMDGTVRAYDMARYRNFRTFTSPRPAQFGCLAVDSSGDLVAAGGVDVFEIYLWSIQTGKLLEVIAGHDGPVSSLDFSPSVTSSSLASVSWDKTLRTWNAIAVGSAGESVQIGSDGTAVCYRPDGLEIAVATLNGQITFFDADSGSQTGCIDGRLDLDIGRSDTDLITAKKSKEGKGYFSCLAYTADGSCILAGGASKVICIYHVAENLLIKKFEVTQNRSFDGMDQVVSRKKMSEFGTNLSLVEDRDDRDYGSKAIRLPGSRKGDMSSRAHRPEVRVSGLKFSPTGREFTATTTEGLLVYSLDNRALFDPIDLEEDITPASTRTTLKRDGDEARALTMALKLNQVDLIREVIEQSSAKEEAVQLIVAGMSDKYLDRLIKFIGTELESTPHIQFYAIWTSIIFRSKALSIKKRSSEVMPSLNLLQKNLMARSKDIGEVCERNIYTIQFLLTIAELKQAKTIQEVDSIEVVSPQSESSSEDEEVTQMEFASNWNG